MLALCLGQRCGRLQCIAGGAAPLPEAMCASLQRNGRREELLAGPSLYGVSISILTVLYWRRPEGIAAVACLCVGDGCAEVVGQRLGRHKLPHNQDKVSPLPKCVSCLRLQLTSFTLPSASGVSIWLGAAAAATAAGAVESLPLGDFDNAAVSIAAAMGMHLLMPAVTSLS